MDHQKTTLVINTKKDTNREMKLKPERILRFSCIKKLTNNLPIIPKIGKEHSARLYFKPDAQKSSS